MVNHASVIYSYFLPCCSGGGKQQSVDNYIDSTWKEIKNLSVTTKYVFSHYRNISLLCSKSTVAFLVKFLCLTFKVRFTTYAPQFTCSDSAFSFAHVSFGIIKIVPLFPSIHVHCVL